jgi:rhamnulokinase
MIPDLCHQALCGASTSEPTIASTSQLLNLDTADWDDRLFSELDLPRHLMPRLRPSGTALGPLRDYLRERLQLPEAVVVQPATHDTASAVAGTPLAPGWAFISSGTWSLVGVERRAPLVEPAVLAANFTNERGVGGTFRFLKNVAGLWILERCRREWQASGQIDDLPRLLAEVASLREPRGLVYPDDPRFFNPPSMLRELRQALTETGQRVPASPAEWARVVLDSLACRYASIIDTLERLTGQPLAGIHIVGGGARNEYLSQATASAAGRPVLAGPVEATALGNILVQAVACGITTLAEGRRRIAEAFPPRRFEPADAGAWRAAARQYEALERTAGTKA